MLPAELSELAREGLILSIVLALPVLAAALLTGILTALLTTFTKISEPAITYIPRIAAVVLAVLAAAPFIATRVVSFTERLFSLVQAVNL